MGPGSQGTSTCSNSGEFKSPSGCFSTDDSFNCDFYVSWQLGDDDNIVFTMKVKFEYFQ